MGTFTYDVFDNDDRGNPQVSVVQREESGSNSTSAGLGTYHMASDGTITVTIDSTGPLGIAGFMYTVDNGVDGPRSATVFIHFGQ